MKASLAKNLMLYRYILIGRKIINPENICFKVMCIIVHQLAGIFNDLFYITAKNCGVKLNTSSVLIEDHYP